MSVCWHLALLPAVPLGPEHQDPEALPHVQARDVGHREDLLRLLRLAPADSSAHITIIFSSLHHPACSRGISCCLYKSGLSCHRQNPSCRYLERHFQPVSQSWQIRRIDKQNKC